MHWGADYEYGRGAFRREVRRAADRLDSRGELDGWHVAGGTVRRVVKTSVYLDSDVDHALARMAAAQGTTKAALICDAPAKATAAAPRPRPRAAGVFEGHGDLARNADDYLARTGFGER